MSLDYATLKAKHRAVRDAPGFSRPLSVRAHRALSWLQRAETEQKDPDARFIFLWIAFNAAYAHEVPDRSAHPERRLFKKFLQRIVDADGDRLVYTLIWASYAGPARLLLDNQFVFHSFWEHQAGRLDEDARRRHFRRSRFAAHRTLAKEDTLTVLVVLPDRLYVLRNQLLHGNATWRGKGSEKGSGLFFERSKNKSDPFSLSLRLID